MTRQEFDRDGCMSTGLSTGSLFLQVSGSYTVTFLNPGPMFEWYMARLVFEICKDTCHDEIGRCAQMYLPLSVQ